MLALAALSQIRTNLISNPTFSHALVGWQPLYTRASKSGVATIDVGRAASASVKIVSSGDQDWAIGEEQAIPVKPGEIVELSAWLKSDQLHHAGISVVTLGSNLSTLDWIHAPVWTDGTHGWQQLKSRFVVPPTCLAIRFRLVGDGLGTVWMTEPRVENLGQVQNLLSPRSHEVTLRNSRLTFTLATDGSAVAETAAHHRWVVAPGEDNVKVRDLVKNSDGSATVSLLDILQDRSYSATYHLSPDSPEVNVQVEGTGPMADKLAFPGPVRTRAEDWVIVPMNEGIMYPANDPTSPTMDLVAYGGHGICMPWFGTTSPTGASAMTILVTPDDASMRLERSSDSLLQPRPIWEPSRQSFRYVRRLKLDFLNSGGYVGMAKRYRAYAKQTGLLITLKEKEKTCPAIDRLVGAVNVWNWDMDVVPLAQELKNIGIERVLWSRGGNPAELTTLNQMGFLTSRYDIYQDVWDPKIALSWMNTTGWPEDLVLLPDGERMKGWAHPDKQPDGTIKWLQGGVICSERGLDRAKLLIPNELKDHPYRCRFIDTTTASPWRECYNPLHPLSRSDDRKYKMELLKFCSQNMGLVVGAETGIDPSVPYLEYYEGMMSLGPYRLPDSGTDMIAYRAPTPDFLKYQVGAFYRLPLWELVYHDCTVAQWYWGDASNKVPEVWNQRDLLNILYGTAPLLMFDKQRWASEKLRMLQTYRQVCGWTRKIGYEEMVSHQYLTPDHLVQKTRFASGRSVIVNFGPQPWTDGSLTVPAVGFKTLEPK